MEPIIQGKAFTVEDDIDTDQILPARYMTTMDPRELAKYAMQDLDPKYGRFLNADGSCDYKIIIARRNFGCGSSREHAPMALAAVGIEAVIANSFARIYYRNSVNGGMQILPLETSAMEITDEIKTGDHVEIDLNRRIVRSKGKEFPIKDFGLVKDIIHAGGLTAYNKKTLGTSRS
jgi:3-isopropylmalate/(R)-2-methylmalate dehydratase small subunit